MPIDLATEEVFNLLKKYSLIKVQIRIIKVGDNPFKYTTIHYMLPTNNTLQIISC